MRSGRSPTFKDREKSIKILLINPFGIGDLLFSTPLIEILKKNLPNASLYYICNKRTSAIIEKSPQLDGVFIFEKGDYKELWRRNKILCLKEFVSFIKKIGKEQFNLAIDMSMGHQYSLILKLINVPRRIGFDYKGRGRFLTERLKFDGFNDKPIGEYYKDLLRLIGLDIDVKPTRIWLTDEDRDYAERFFREKKIVKSDTVIGIAPGGGVSFGREKVVFKRWPYEKFAELADFFIKDMSSKVMLLWGPGEEDLVVNIQGAMSTKPIVSPSTTVRQMAALMSRCTCVVCNDSGPLHLAVAAGARTSSIFGPSDENVYGPYLRSDQHLCITKDLECRPCYKRFSLPNCESRVCLNDLGAREVFLAIANHIGKRS